MQKSMAVLKTDNVSPLNINVICFRPRETNKFDLQVNVAAKQEVTFYLTYQEILKRTTGLYHNVIYIDPGQLVPDFSINVKINETRQITKVNVPPLRTELLTERNDKGKSSFNISNTFTCIYANVQDTHVHSSWKHGLIFFLVGNMYNNIISGHQRSNISWCSFECFYRL